VLPVVLIDAFAVIPKKSNLGPCGCTGKPAKLVAPGIGPFCVSKLNTGCSVPFTAANVAILNTP
jgi:hypothetical protein